MLQRTMKIDGDYKQVAFAIRLIYQIIEERSSKVIELDDKT